MRLSYLTPLTILFTLLLPAVGHPQNIPAEGNTVPDLVELGASSYVCIGNTVYFFGDLTRHNRGSGADNLYRIGLDGEGLEPLLTPEQVQEIEQGRQNLVGSGVSHRLAFLTRSTRPAEQEGDWPVRLMLFDPITKSLETLVDNGQNLSWPVFSPTGDRIAFFSAPANVYTAQWNQNLDTNQGYALDLIDLQSMEEREIAPQNRLLFASAPPAWSPNSQRLAFCALQSRDEGTLIHIVDATGDNHRALRESCGYDPQSVVWIDNSTLLFHTTFPEHTPWGIYRMDTIGGEPELIREGNLGERLSLSPDRQLIRTMEIGPDGRQSERIITVTGETPTTDPTDRLFHGQWRLTSALPASRE